MVKHKGIVEDRKRSRVTSPPPTPKEEGRKDTVSVKERVHFIQRFSLSSPFHLFSKGLDVKKF